MLPPGLASLVPIVAQPQMPGMPPTQQSTYGAYEQLLMSAPHLLAGYVPPPSVASSTGGGYNPAAGPAANETNGMPMNLMALLERQNQHSVPSLPPPAALRSPPTPSVPQSQPSIQDIMALLVGIPFRRVNHCHLMRSISAKDLANVKILLLRGASNEPLVTSTKMT
jgi:hypothetical protein